MFYKAKTVSADLLALVSASARYAVFVPLYGAVKAAHRHNVSVPFRLTNAALHGQRRARHDLEDLTWYFWG